MLPLLLFAETLFYLLLFTFKFKIFENNVINADTYLLATLLVNYLFILIYNYQESFIFKLGSFLYSCFSIFSIYMMKINLLSSILCAELCILWSLIIIYSSRRDRDISLEVNKYFLIQGFAGLCLLFGLAKLNVPDIFQAGNIFLHEQPFLAQLFLFLGFGIKAGFPLFNSWIYSIYPNVFPNATILLSIFTTKIGIFGLYYLFPGYSILIYIGAFIAILHLFYAFVENNVMKSYSHILNNQMGCMMLGIGIGTDEALIGVLALLVCQICYETFIFMVMGSVVSGCNSEKFSEFNKDLVINSPLMHVLVVCIIFVAGMPYFAGYFGKSVFLNGLKSIPVIYYSMKIVLIGVFLVAAIRPVSMIDFNSFENKDNRRLVKLALSDNIYIALFLQMVLCLFIGLFGHKIFNISYYVNDVKHSIEQLSIIILLSPIFYCIFRLDFYSDILKAVESLNNKFLFYQKMIFNYISNKCYFEDCNYPSFNRVNFNLMSVFENTSVWLIISIIIALIIYLT